MGMSLMSVVIPINIKTFRGHLFYLNIEMLGHEKNIYLENHLNFVQKNFFTIVYTLKIY